MSSLPSSSSSATTDKVGAKNDARNDRLRKVNEEVLRKKLEAEAKEICAPLFRAFGDCAKENGLSVIFRCNKQNQAVSDCLDKHCNDKKFEEFLAVRGITREPKKEWYAKYVS